MQNTRAKQYNTTQNKQLDKVFYISVTGFHAICWHSKFQADQQVIFHEVTMHCNTLAR